MTANMCVSNENDKYNAEQRIAIFFIHSFFGSRCQNDTIYCLQLGWQESLQTDFSKPSCTSDLQFMVI